MATLLDRDRELACLEAVLEELPAGGSPAVVVEGEPDIGKTRLLAELAERVCARGGTVVSSRAAEYETTLPFAAFVDALDDHAETALRLAPADVVELARLLPSLGDVRAETSLVDERHRLHNATRKLLPMLAGDALLLVVLEDLHCADPASVDPGRRAAAPATGRPGAAGGRSRSRSGSGRTSPPPNATVAPRSCGSAR